MLLRRIIQRCREPPDFKPNFLHFGRELASNVSVLLAGPTVNHENYSKFAAELIERLSSAHEMAQNCLNQSAVQSKILR